ncbi:MAG: hypothetical protein MUC55_00445 [Burkholderiales bacterium]|jgi:hypothetical protein|nr:hypothetical protein [Burkholderiales bacterium]
MSTDPQTGALRIDDRLATGVAFDASRAGHRVGGIDLRFLEGATEIARVSLKRDEALALLGDKNLEEIERRIRTLDPRETWIEGELRGPHLHYREVRLAVATLAEEGNVFEAGPLRARRLQSSRPRAGNAPAAAPTQTIAAQASPAPATALTPNANAQATPRDPFAMPAHVAAKYLRDRDRYHMRDQSLAFVDRGTKLRVETENRAVLGDLVAIAQARGWQVGVVRGTENFRRAMWHAAYLQGFTVQGYTPSAIELQAAERERVRAQTAQAAPSVHATPAAPPAPTTVPSAIAATPAPGVAGTVPSNPSPHSRARTPHPAQAVVYGTLVAHGEAPYRFDHRNDPSYFVRLRLEHGAERSYWGAGLEDALRAGATRPAVGEAVGLRIVGEREVTRLARRVDAHGEIHEQRVPAKRNDWVLEHAAYFAEPGRLERDLAARTGARGATGTAQTTPHPASPPASASPKASPAPPREPAEAAHVDDAQLTRVVPAAKTGIPIGWRGNHRPTYGTLLAHGEPHDPLEARDALTLRLDDGREMKVRAPGLVASLAATQTQPKPGDRVGVLVLPAHGRTGFEGMASGSDPRGQFILYQDSRPLEWVVEKAAYFAEPGRFERDLEARAAARARGALAQTPAGPVQPDEREAAARNARATREALERRSPEVAEAVLSTQQARDQFVQAFVDAGLVRAEERATVMRVFEAKVAERERQGRPVQLSGRDVSREIASAVQRAVDEIGRAPMAAPTGERGAQVPTPKPRVRDAAPVRG